MHRSSVRPFGRRIIAALWSLLLALGACGSALADVQASVAATDPASDATLGRDEPFYVRVRFEADEPVSLWVRPFLDGKPVQHAKSNASGKHAGAGYALGWFSLDDASRVDEVRILAGGGHPYREWLVATYPVSVAGTGAPAPTRERAAWVGELSHAEDIARRQAYEQQMKAPVTGTETALMSGFMLAILALLVTGVAVPAWAAWKWRGGWRMAAAVPVALMGFVVLRIVVGTSIDPTSHNLWPFEILMWGGLSLLLVGGIAFVRRLTGGGG